MTNNVCSYQNIKMETAKPGFEDIVSNTSRSMCVSDKTTVKNHQQILTQVKNTQSPFAEIT